MTGAESEVGYGDTGKWVLRLQTRLHALGLFDQALDAVFDEGTRRAVSRLQEGAELAVTGVVDAATWAALAAAEREAGLHDPFEAAGAARGPAPRDDLWEWDGQQWQHKGAADSPAREVAAESVLPGDRQWVWDGTRWQPAGS